VAGSRNRLAAELVALILFACAWLAPSLARASVARGVQSSVITLELMPDGSATVHYELALSLRGERFKSFRVPGIDPDAVLLPEATALRTDDARTSSEPLRLTPSVTGDDLELDVPVKNGAVGRTFLLRFGYRTELYERGLLRELPGGARVLLEWTGPHFDNGIDSATLIVRTAAAASPPAVPAEPGPELAEAGGRLERRGAAPRANYGTVVSTLRRSNGSDEIELVRPHTARGEAVRWRLELDAGLFEHTLPAEPEAVASVGVAAAPRALRPAPPPARHAIAWAALFGIVYALLAALKTHWAVRGAELTGCHARALIELPRSLRVALAGFCFALAALLVTAFEAPIPAALALIGALLLAAFGSPELAPALRGPGEWRPLTEDVFAQKPPPPLPGAWFDAGRAQGFVLLAVLLGGWGFAAASLYSTSPYEGACALIGSAALLPLFCTGRLSDLPLDPLRHSKVFFKRLSKKLGKQKDLSLTPLGRFAQAGGEMDELRLSLAPEKSLPGLLGLEVALEFHHGLGGAGATPVVLVRAADGSPCYRALPRELVWTRGRSAEERVSLIQPRLPTLAVCTDLVEELLVLLAGPQREAASERKNAARSSGNALSTVKAGTRASPAQAT
jgi:hypothetical protein